MSDNPINAFNAEHEKWRREIANLIASRPTPQRKSRTKAEAYEKFGTLNEVDKDLAAAGELVSQAMRMDLWPDDRLMVLCEEIAFHLQAFPANEHALRLAFAMNTVGYCHRVDPLTFTTLPAGKGSRSYADLIEHYGEPADMRTARLSIISRSA